MQVANASNLMVCVSQASIVVVALTAAVTDTLDSIELFQILARSNDNTIYTTADADAKNYTQDTLRPTLRFTRSKTGKISCCCQGDRRQEEDIRHSIEKLYRNSYIFYILGWMS